MRKTILAALFIIFVIASCSKKAAPTTASKIVMIDGSKVFSQNCARCHGPQGIGDRTPNLQTIALDKTHLVNSITNGKGHMPSFKDKLSPDEISVVADLIVGWHSK